MKPWALVFLLATASAGLTQVPAGPPVSPWRAFTQADGLPENACLSVTMGASGKVFVRHAGTNTISVLDGYQVTCLPAPTTNRHRVYEGRSGQLWMVAPEGLLEIPPEGLREPREPQWTLHPVPEIARHFRAGGPDPIPLCPVRLGATVFLLPDQLMLFDAGESDSRQTVLLRAAQQTRLGHFAALSLASDDSLWICGTRGVARIPGPLRGVVKPDSTWEEFLPPADLPIRNFQSVQQQVTGDWIALAESAASPAPTLVLYQQNRWSVQALPVHHVRFVWRGLDQTWLATTNALFTLNAEHLETVPHDGIPLRHIYDVAVEPTGAFWLATADGVSRKAAPLWRPLARAAPSQSPPPQRGHRALAALSLPDDIARLTEWQTHFTTRAGDLWLAGAHEIAWRRQNVWRVFTPTDLFGLREVVAFAETPDGQIWCATSSAVWAFDGTHWVAERAGLAHVNGLCGARDGTLWVAADNGVHRLTRGVWIANGPEDGLPAGPVRAVSEDENGRISVLTPLGMFEYRPESDPDPPETFVTTTPLAQRRFREGASVSLSFRGRDKWKLTSDDRLLFAYRLDGREWSAFGDDRQVTFSDLSLGKHFLQARALDRAGNVDPEPALLEFVVVLPWYREPRLVLVLAVALVIALFFAGVAFNRQRQLRRSYAVVEEQVAARTRELELANRELLHSQKMNALGTLAAGIAHDFNNILSIIKGSAQIIEENLENPDKIRLRLDRIKTAVAQGAGIVHAMLGFSRNSNEAAGPCDVNQVVDDTMTLLGDRFLREVEITFDRAADLPAVAAGKDFIQQILLNFLFNAADAMTARKRIVIRTRPLTELPPELVLKPAGATAYVALAVQDFGCGIPPENLARIFEPFFTTKALSSRRGTGLGLSMVYELARRLNAGLAVESAVGRGSTFTLLLPVPSPAPEPLAHGMRITESPPDFAARPSAGPEHAGGVLPASGDAGAASARGSGPALQT